MSTLLPLRISRKGSLQSHEHQLFAIYQAPDEGDARSHAILLCNPFGQEAIRAHRLYKVLADRLVRLGFHVMRFDYYGSGDSDGDDEDVDFETWLADISIAHSQLLSQSACQNISWFGLKLGATLASLASRRLEMPLTKLVLWEPVINGAQYLHDLMAYHDLALQQEYGARDAFDDILRRQFASSRGHEALGFGVSAAMQAWLRSIDDETFDTPNAISTTLFSRWAAPTPTSDRKAIERSKRDPALALQRPALLTEKPLPVAIDWMANEMMNSSVVPTGMLEAVIAEFEGTT